MQVGDLFVWKKSNQLFGRHSCEGRTGIYLGEDFIYREDGVVVQNHKILFCGDAVPTTIDVGVLRCLKKLIKEKE